MTRGHQVPEDRAPYGLDKFDQFLKPLMTSQVRRPCLDLSVGPVGLGRVALQRRDLLGVPRRAGWGSQCEARTVLIST